MGTITSAPVSTVAGLSAVELAEGLARYSQKGEAYISLIQNLIRNYIPQDLELFLEKN